MLSASDTVLKIAFATYRNVNLGTARHFASLGVTPADFFSHSARQLAAITGLRESFFDNARRETALENAAREAAFAEDNNITVRFCGDDNYPARLAECSDAPAVIFTLGTCAECPHVVSIVGTRHATAYGVGFVRSLVADLAASLDGLVIISGLAYGADIAAHRAAMAENVPTGAILAHGLNTVYPADHRDEARRILRQGGFLATEYLSSSAIHKGNFLARNRIVAGMADVTVVVESDRKGGAMSTARIAGAYNREVMALPGRTTDTYSRGCNALIASGEASMIRDAGDLIDAMGWATKPVEGKQAQLPFLTPEQTTITDYLKTNPDATVNDLCAALAIPYARLSSSLFEMEMDGVVSSLPGGRYCILNADV